MVSSVPRVKPLPTSWKELELHCTEAFCKLLLPQELEGVSPRNSLPKFVPYNVDLIWLNKTCVLLSVITRDTLFDFHVLIAQARNGMVPYGTFGNVTTDLKLFDCPPGNGNTAALQADKPQHSARMYWYPPLDVYDCQVVFRMIIIQGKGGYWVTEKQLVNICDSPDDIFNSVGGLSESFEMSHVLKRLNKKPFTFINKKLVPSKEKLQH